MSLLQDPKAKPAPVDAKTAVEWSSEAAMKEALNYTCYWGPETIMAVLEGCTKDNCANHTEKDAAKTLCEADEACMGVTFGAGFWQLRAGLELIVTSPLEGAEAFVSAWTRSRE